MSPAVKNSTIRYLVVFLIIAGVGVTSGLLIYFDGNSGNPEDTPTTRTIVDMANKTVTIPYTVNRVAVQRIQIAEAIIVLDGRNKIVAWSDPTSFNWLRKVFPGIINVSFAFTKSDVNIEQLLLAQPDVVFIQVGDDAMYEKLSVTGIPIVQVSKLTDQEMNQMMLTIGEVLGEAEYERAKTFNTYFNSKVAFVADRTANLTEEDRPSILYLGSISPNYVVYGMYASISEYIYKAGGANVATSVTNPLGTAIVDAEAILAWNPDMIMVSTTPTLMSGFLANEALQGLDAFQNDAVYINPQGVYGWHSKVPETPLQVLWLAKTIHPTLFTDVDLNAEIKSFYSTYWEYNLTDLEVSYILNATAPPLSLK